MIRTLMTCGLVLMVTACSSMPERNAAPANMVATQGVLTDPAIRIWGDVPYSIEQAIINESNRRDSFDLSLIVDEDGQRKPQHHLTISGGGANGAYGAGILNALSDSGERPEYRLVTGISTGAILGLYAFLGEEYDYKIKELYTELSDEDLYDTRYVWQLFNSSSILNTELFSERVRNEVNRELLDKVKHEYLRGRTFLVKTTNLDSQRPVIWNMGAIAMHDSEEAEQLFENVIIASASIPGVFEPVQIPVYDGDQIYDEMHVDGGVISQVFFVPEGVDIGSYSAIEDRLLFKAGLTDLEERTNHIWLINNGRSAATWRATDPSLMAIMARSIATMIKFQSRSNLALIYQQSQEAGSSFNLSFIHNDVPDPASDAPFNREYMRSMYCYGYVQGLDPEHWSHTLPDYDKLQNLHSEIDEDADINTFDWNKVAVGLNAKIKECLMGLTD
ncbi:patatin-like phospholipase family protein [Vibrio astriarenae]|uniref:patatin-like phospholipase family protein n=1 Tax=Vibrio astriarenae TaxID=1481923 RepID=UPI0037364F15